MCENIMRGVKMREKGENREFAEEQGLFWKFARILFFGTLMRSNAKEALFDCFLI